MSYQKEPEDFMKWLENLVNLNPESVKAAEDEARDTLRRHVNSGRKISELLLRRIKPDK